MPDAPAAKDDKDQRKSPLELEKISLRHWQFAPEKVVELFTGVRPQRDQLGRIIPQH